MLADPSLSGPTRDAVVDVFIRELRSIAPYGAILIFDDFHLVDEAPDVQFIVREIVARAPERLTIVFASRRAPGIPIARLRAIGEVAELTTDDLRFDADETDRLFREAYGRDLDAGRPRRRRRADRRLGGIAAARERRASRPDAGRDPGIRPRAHGCATTTCTTTWPRRSSATCAPDLQGFLMRTSILQIVTPDLAEVASGMDASESARLTASAERVTLLSRRAKGQRRELRYHPLVREFLEARLARDHGIEAVQDPASDRRAPRRRARLADRGPPLLGRRRPASSARDHRRRGAEHHRPRRLPRRRAVRRPGGRRGPARELPRGSLASRLQARRHPRRPDPRQASRRVRPRLRHRPREPGVVEC